MAAAALIAVIAGVSGPAHADGKSAPPRPAVRAAKTLTEFKVQPAQKAKLETFDQYQMADLQAAAQSTGADLETLKKTHFGVTEFAAVVDAVRKATPDTFVQAGVGTAEDPTPWVVFTGRPNEGIISQFSTLPTDSEILYGAPASYAELEQAVATLVNALGQQDGVVSAGAGVVGKGDAIEVVEGGRNLNLADSNDPDCTGAFTVTRNGEKGMITAQHCANGLRYNSSLGVIQYVAAARSSLSGRTDLQFHRTMSGNSTNSQFRATGTSSTDDRTVTAASNPVSGQIACHWGMTTGYSCSSVESTNFCVDYDDWETACNLDSTVARIDDKGDSGGPWFYGATAIGVHSGGSTPGNFSLFTRIGAVNDFLDATVLK